MSDIIVWEVMMNWETMKMLVILVISILILNLAWLGFQRLRIILQPGDKENALKRSIDRSWLHHLGGGGASQGELWVMTILATLAVLYKIFTCWPFDIMVLFDTVVFASTVFVVANVIRMAIARFWKQPVTPASLEVLTRENAK